MVRRNIINDKDNEKKPEKNFRLLSPGDPFHTLYCLSFLLDTLYFFKRRKQHYAAAYEIHPGAVYLG